VGKKSKAPTFKPGDNVLMSPGAGVAPMCMVVLQVGPVVDGERLYQVTGPEHGHGTSWASEAALSARPAGDESEHHKHHHVEKLLRELEEIEHTEQEILDTLRGQAGPQLNLSIREVHGKASHTMKLPPLALLDTEKVLLSVAPQNADGTPDTTTTVSWASSDPSVGLDVQADTRSAFALTPLDKGGATVTVSAPGTPMARWTSRTRPVFRAT
jgi:hypothetical protein